MAWRFRRNQAECEAMVARILSNLELAESSHDDLLRRSRERDVAAFRLLIRNGRWVVVIQIRTMCSEH